MIGDGESQEGQIWEALMAAPNFKLDNLCVMLDFNGLQIDGDITKVMDPTPFVEKYKAFRWHTIEIDGHDLQQIEKAFAEAKTIKGQPTIIVAHTVKGKGVSYMENEAGWHGSAPNPEQTKQALSEIEGVQ
jgi:transketolase